MTDHRVRNLLLLVNVICLSVGSLLGSDSVQTFEGASLSDGLEGLELLEVVSKGHGSGSLDILLDGHNLSGQLNSLGQFLSAGISLPWLLGVQGEEDELALVFLETLSILLKRLNTLVPGK